MITLHDIDKRLEALEELGSHNHAMLHGIQTVLVQIDSGLEAVCHDLACLLGLNSNSIRIIPTIGKIVEQSGPVAMTPKYLGPVPSKRNLIMAFQMSDSQQTTLSVKFVDKKGQPASVDGVPEWSTDNTDVLALTPAADGLSCGVASVGPLGTGTVTLKADADLGAGVTPVIGTLEIQITGGAAAVATLDAAPPTEQPS